MSNEKPNSNAWDKVCGQRLKYELFHTSVELLDSESEWYGELEKSDAYAPDGTLSAARFWRIGIDEVPRPEKLAKLKIGKLIMWHFPERFRDRMVHPEALVVGVENLDGPDIYAVTLHVEEPGKDGLTRAVYTRNLPRHPHRNRRVATLRDVLGLQEGVDALKDGLS